MFNPISQCFSDNFKNDITKTYRPIIRWANGVINLKNETNMSVINIRHITIIIKDVQSKLHNVLINSIPVMMIK